MVRIVGIESSCDETAVGIVEEGHRILANTVASSLHQHAAYGGVIPEIAARAHVESIWQVFAHALEESGLAPNDLDGIAVTHGPGLSGALHIGLAFAKGLALSLDRPLIGVDHLAAHLYAGQMTDLELRPPFVGLVVSGGHTLLCVVHEEGRFELLGETKDDAVGEAFDKVAKMLGLGYPGGPIIDRLSAEGQASIAFPRTQTKQSFDFSFSGLKTAVYQYIRSHTRPTSEGHKAEVVPPQSGGQDAEDSPLSSQAISDIAASFQETVVETLVTKTLRACQRTGLRDVVVGGGVASNRRLRERLKEEASSKKYRVIFPPPGLCVDNGAMVAGLGFSLLQRGKLAPLNLAIDPNLCLATQ